MRTPDEVTQETVEALFAWAGLQAEADRYPEKAKLLRLFQERVQRLSAVEVDKIQFDFLHPME